MRLVAEHGWRLSSVKGDHHTFKHPRSRHIVTIVHPQKDVPIGRANYTAKALKMEGTE
jgi:predicted RNA binding protein YcfA (HicA-like mRNA interferase family)